MQGGEEAVSLRRFSLQDVVLILVAAEGCSSPRGRSEGVTSKEDQSQPALGALTVFKTRLRLCERKAVSLTVG